ncbi:MAG: cadmium-translocating P-type ATPase [Bdellovibrionales bacterium CG12_big_fil_rev_8_21_14_0_65_38_15]|nr:MAG: cadmium-translocating P-type ATPase [Bdellovibrionales bacterium CG22_combo_CG10-13_8_21_14_all_38_13]PIQ57000.1 MAG: cadmium-translocating P-type ATPase [Bdellovibrionales bacterium CG12_big_fil_rev_8_21_14_0_65_38_15]PIR29039.1 MAG: cadmium-translocating P-type ATPase [Bdellovibrionales bacterium CG11_big_fil_rev_8_21_14_0_20_38_13]
MITTAKQKQLKTKAQCTHCDEIVLNAIYDDNDQHIFCCHGCKAVFDILNLKGLEDYYTIKEKAGSYKRRSPVEVSNRKYKHLDDINFINEYSYKNSYGDRTLEFYLEGIHCLACLWLIEKLSVLNKDIITSKLDMEKSIVTISIRQSGKFSSVASELNQLGYKPHPIKRDQKSFDLKNQEERRNLLRIGVAAAGMSNIMLYAISLYAGAEGQYAVIFNILTVIFGIPVLTYSAYPFYQNAFNSIQNRILSIDIPISIALIIGLAMGLYNVMNGINENFFDSLTMLVFLLLISRYFLRKIQDKALSTNDLHYFYVGASVQRSKDKDHKIFEEVHPKYIQQGDILRIDAGEFIAADSTIIDGESSLNSSLLTGESLPVSVRVGDIVHAGTQNLTSPLLIKVDKSLEKSRIGEILKEVETGWSLKAPIVQITDKMSYYFILGVFFIGLVLFTKTLVSHDLKYAIEQTLTLLIVTCPCALALATPLAFTTALSRLAKNGILIKNDSILQKISELKTIFFDKTGTLTLGEVEIIDFKILQNTSNSIFDIIFTLEQRSKHPVAKALVKYAKLHKAKKLDSITPLEIPGIGVKAKIGTNEYTISQKGIFENNNLIATYIIKDSLRNDTIESLNNIKKIGYNINILSGDLKQNVFDIAKQLEIDAQNVYAQVSPEEKSRIIKNSNNSIMVGDGANDAIALSHADVGVAVYGSMDISLKASDVFLSIPGISAITTLIIVSKETMKVIKRNLALSLVYNLLSVIGVFMGVISPLVAAIIMPLSSLTIFVSTQIGTKEMRQVWKS